MFDEQNDEWNAHEEINKVFENFSGRISLDESDSNLTNDQQTSEQVAAGAEDSSPTVNTPPPPSQSDPRDTEIAELKQKLDNASRGYQQLQSQKDKLDAALRSREEALASRLQQLESRLMGNGQEQQLYDQSGQVNQNQLEYVIDQRAKAIASQILSNHPGVKAGEAITDWARFASANPDLQLYSPIVQRFIERSPDVPGESYYDKLTRALEFSRQIVEDAKATQGMANNQAQAAMNANQPTSPTGQRPPLPSMAAKAQQYHVEQGSAASAPAAAPKQPDYRRPLQEQVRELISVYNRKNQ